MPGLIPHLIAGSTIYLIGRYSFKKYFNGIEKNKERILLLFICLFFSIIPDIFLGIYYATSSISLEIRAPYRINTQLHMIITPITIIFSLFLTLIDPKRKPIWLLGICAVIVHLIMDHFITEYGLLF